MDKGSYQIDILNKKYGAFLGPAIEIKIGGVKLDSNSLPISSLTVDLSADGSAGNCTFTVDSLYDYETGGWTNKLVKLLKVGAKLEVYGGYVKKELLFFGYIDEFAMSYKSGGSPQIRVSGVDGLGYLMSCRDDYYGGEKSTAAAIKEILSKCVTAGFAKKVSVDSGLKDFETPIIKDESLDDYKFLRVLAERYGMVLMCVQGELIFDSLWEYSRPIMELELGRGLMSFERALSTHGQVGKVTVWSLDDHNESVLGTADKVSVGGTGKTAADTFSSLKKAILRESSEFATTKEECKRLAQARLNGIAMEYVRGEGQCIGIPELIPGRFIAIKGLGDESSKEFFISRVTHSFTSGGYFTRFEVKGAKA